MHLERTFFLSVLENIGSRHSSVDSANLNDVPLDTLVGSGRLRSLTYHPAAMCAQGKAKRGVKKLFKER